MTSKRQVWLHVHVPKAGGSTLRQLMNRTFGDGYYNSVSLLETRQYSRHDVGEIIRIHPWLTALSDHKLSLDIPYDHPAADVRVLCFVRDPVERFISRYFFHRHYEEVECIAQRMSFHEFADAELVQEFVHPQTNSQIYFLTGGRSNTDLALVYRAIESGRVHLFPIERFDEACVFLERVFPAVFADLSHVNVNQSRRDSMIEESDREFVRRFVLPDQAICDFSHRQLDAAINTVFSDSIEFERSLADFRQRCSQRVNNFTPIRPSNREPESSINPRVSSRREPV